MAKKLKITQVKSAIDRVEKQKRTLKALGLNKLHKSVVHNDCPVIRGMVRTVIHMIKVEEVTGE